jgi:hypothetical protein
LRAADRSGATALLQDTVVLAADDFQVLNHILAKGELPQDFKEKVERLSAERRPRAPG